MTEPSITIRPAVPEDATAIAEVHVASWRTTYPGIVDQAFIDGLSVEDRAAAWARRLGDREASAPDIIVAVAPDGGVVGFASGGVIREPVPGFDGELYAIYLLDTVQRAGVGRRLAREWAGMALERGVRAAVVRVLAANPACAFYERLGGERLRDIDLVIGGRPYAGRVYGWRDLDELAR